MRIKFGPLVTMLATLITCFTAYGQQVPSISILKGQPLRNYPKLILMSQSPLVNVYWSNNIDCKKEPENCERVVDQDAALQIQKQIETSVRVRIENFDSNIAELFPSRHSTIHSKLFPISIKIQLGEEMLYTGYVDGESSEETFNANGSLIGPIPLKSRISIGIQNAPLGTISSIDTLIMHEIGHVILRALDFPRMESKTSGRADSLLEETLPDFIASSTNDDTPFVAPGLQNSVAEMMRVRLADPNTETFQRAKIAMDLRGMSQVALRDFSKSYTFPDLYLLPGAYNSSLTFNAMFYRLKPAMEGDYLRNTLLRAIVERPGMLNQADAYEVLKGLIGFFGEIYPEQFHKRSAEIRSVLRNSDWLPAQKTANTIGFETSVDAEHSINVKIKPAFNINSLFPTTMRTLTYTVYVADKPRFAFSQYLDYSLARRLRFNPVQKCEASSVLCICGLDKDRISVDAVYLSSKKTVEATKRSNLKSPSFRDSACYILSFEWEDL